MTSWRVHKTRGTCRIVWCEAEECAIESGALVFRTQGRIVMAYAPWAWKTAQEEGRPPEEVEDERRGQAVRS